MFDRHAVFRQELHRIQKFALMVDTHKDQMTPATGSRTAPEDHILQHVSVAFEDIPEDMHDAVRVIFMHPTEQTSLLDRITDVAKNAVGGGYGELEIAARRLDCLHILSSLSAHKPYTYRVDGKVIRGSRPTADKLRRLYDGGCRATINLCKEMDRGDEGLIADAELTGDMRTEHIKITDNTPPTPGQVARFLAHLKGLPGQVYVHCEAGVGRTGVMVACYRMSQGWTLANALHEARQFGCSMPDQLAFIENHAVAPGAAAPGLTAVRSSDDVPRQPSDDALAETALMNQDPIGLDRVLGVVVTAATGSPDGHN